MTDDPVPPALADAAPSDAASPGAPGSVTLSEAKPAAPPAPPPERVGRLVLQDKRLTAELKAHIGDLARRWGVPFDEATADLLLSGLDEAARADCGTVRFEPRLADALEEAAALVGAHPASFVRTAAYNAAIAVHERQPAPMPRVAVPPVARPVQPPPRPPATPPDPEAEAAEDERWQRRFFTGSGS